MKNSGKPRHTLIPTEPCNEACSNPNGFQTKIPTRKHFQASKASKEK